VKSRKSENEKEESIMNKLEVINENLLADSSNMENTAYIQKQMELIEQEIYLHERREEEDDL